MEQHVDGMVLANNLVDLSLRSGRDRVLKIEKYGHILDWLSPINPEVNHERARSLRQLGTGAWLLNDARFKKWFAGEIQFLWVHGIPGSGKTVLTSTVIAELQLLVHASSQDNPVGLAYMYIDFKDERSQDPTTVFGTIIKELYLQLPSSDMHPSIQNIYDMNYNKSTGEVEKPSLTHLIDLLSEVTAALDKVYMVIDALDESSHDVQENILCPTLKWLATQHGSKIATFLTSRNSPVIQEAFGSLPNVNLEADLISNDIARYVEADIQRRPILAAAGDEAQAQLLQQIVKGAHGMFRWASCQLDVLSKLQSTQEISQALKSLPTGLYETYDRILQGVGRDDEKTARRALTWLANAARPLSSAELIEAISVDPGDKGPNRDKGKVTLGDLLRICGGLMVELKIDKSTVVGLAHASVREYLRSSGTEPPGQFYRIPDERANQELAHICLTYLAFDVFKNGPVGEYADHQSRLAAYPLLEYAAKNASIHFRRGQLEPAGRWNQVLFPQTNKKDRIHNNLKSWRQARDGFGYHEPFMIPVNLEATPLFFASEAGLTSIVKRLVAFGVDVNTDCWYGTALQAASAGGHLDIVEELLRNNANVNASGEEFGTPLQAACVGGHASTARTLVENGADINQVSGFSGTALAAAAYRGKDELVQLLLNSGANINTFAGRYGTALLAASYRGRTSIVQLLLNNSADISIQGTRYGNALKAASEEGHLQVVRILINKGADINIIGAEYGTALQSASRGGSETVVRALLDAGAAVDAIGGYYGSALQAAARTNLKVTKALLNAGADVNLEAGHYGNALAAAVYFGKTDIVGLLLDRGANANSASVQAAILEGHEDTASLLRRRMQSPNRAQL
ncbi:MAG: hypothetical protein Q9219_002431 [cf. Caloplaca sp. 3 TL-2023]